MVFDWSTILISTTCPSPFLLWLCTTAIVTVIMIVIVTAIVIVIAIVIMIVVLTRRKIAPPSLYTSSNSHCVCGEVSMLNHSITQSHNHSLTHTSLNHSLTQSLTPLTLLSSPHSTVNCLTPTLLRALPRSLTHSSSLPHCPTGMVVRYRNKDQLYGVWLLAGMMVCGGLSITFRNATGRLI